MLVLVRHVHCHINQLTPPCLSYYSWGYFFCRLKWCPVDESVVSVNMWKQPASTLDLQVIFDNTTAQTADNFRHARNPTNQLIRRCDPPQTNKQQPIWQKFVLILKWVRAWGNQFGVKIRIKLYSSLLRFSNVEVLYWKCCRRCFISFATLSACDKSW